MVEGSTLVRWYGAHPENRSTSMDIYRLALCDALKRTSDPSSFEVSAWPHEELALDKNKSRVRKALANYVSYPTRVFLESRKASLVHFLDHSSAHLIPRVHSTTKTVVTLHDLIPLRYPGDLNASQVERFQAKANQLKQADAIVAVSDYSKNEAVELAGCHPDSIFVVPNGVRLFSDHFEQSDVVSQMREKGCAMVVFSIGSTLPRKRLSILPEAMNQAQKILGGKIGLIRAGASLDNALRMEIESVVGKDFFHEFGRVDQETLDGLYHETDLVFIPSLYEGFGLPVLEAFAAGKAVACSNRTSLPEVGKEEAFYFNPDDCGSAGQAIARGLPSNVSEQSINRRKAIAHSHSWERHLSSLFEVYRKVLDESQ